MDNTTRDHLIKMMKKKIESEMSDSLNGLEDYERLGERITSALKEKFTKNSIEEEDNGSLFDDDDDEFYEPDFMSEEEADEEEFAEETINETPEAEIPPIVEEVTEDVLEMEVSNQVDVPGEVIELPNLEDLNPQEISTEEDSILDLGISKELDQEKGQLVEDEKEQAIQKLQKQFEKEFEILQTIHKLERWEVAKRHRQLEEDFITEFELKLKEIQNSL